MSAITLQRPLLHHLSFQTHFAIPPFCRAARFSQSESRSVLLRRSLLWIVTPADVVAGRWDRSENIFGRGKFPFPWVCRAELGVGKVSIRGLKTVKTVKKSVVQMEQEKIVVEEKVVVEEKISGRKRPTLVPKQLNLRPAGVHGNTFISFVQILGTGMDTRDTSPSVLLFFDKRRIIFNAGEGLQRFCIEHKIKLSKLDHVFLTRIVSETASGLPGLLLTLSNTGETGMAVNLWGPSDLNVLVDAMRTFIPNSSVVHAHSFGTETDSPTEGGRQDLNVTTHPETLLLLEDEVVKISAVLLRPDAVHPASSSRPESPLAAVIKTDESASSKGTYFKSLSPKSSANQMQGASLPFAEPWELGFNSTITADQNETQKRIRVERASVTKATVMDEGLKSETKTFAVLSKQSSNLSTGPPGSLEIAAVYICELPEIIGKFDPEKAKALGLRPGRKYGLLQAGNSVVADDGKTTVHPSDVMDPSSPGPIILVVDCPSPSHIVPLISAPGFKSFSSKMSNGAHIERSKKVTCIIHIGPASVVNCSQYREWMAGFEGTQHLMAGHGMQSRVPPVLKASARLMSRLNVICPQVFPVAGLLQADDEMEICQDKFSSGLITSAENLLKFRLRPITLSPFDRSLVPSPLNISAVQHELIGEDPALQDASRTIAELWNTSSGNTLEYPSEAVGSPSKPTGQMLTESLEQVDDGLPEELPECLKGVSREEMEIVFLGTGSSQPSKYRNVSSIYIHLFKRGGVLLDCGEGTYGQLKRRYGNKSADEIVAGLKCVWVSHIHADHHTGLVRILSVRKKVLDDKGRFEQILVVGPKQLKRYLDAYARLEDLGMDFLDCSQTTIDAEKAAGLLQKRDVTNGSGSSGNNSIRGDLGIGVNSPVGLVRLVPQEKSSNGQPIRSQLRNYWLQSGVNFYAGGLDEEGREKLRATLSGLGLSQLTSVPVVHCPHAFGVVLVARGKKLLQPGWRLVYSGDTRPCQALVEASKGATVLIHEATFDDAMPEEAIAKNHSLTCEAIETGIAAGAYRTILTHFSQRYPKIPVFNDSYNNRTCIAFDMMSANLADLPLLPKLLPALKLLFKDDLMVAEEEGEEIVEQS